MLQRRRPLLAHRISLGVALLGIVVPVALGLFTPSPASADCGGAPTSVISGDICKGTDVNSNDSADNPIIAVLIFVMQLMTGAVGIAAIGALIYAGILYSAAGGEAGQVQKAKTIIKDTVIGVVVYGFMIIILNFVIPGGVFGQNSTVGSGTKGGSSGSSEDPLQTSDSSRFVIVSMPDTQFEVNREAKYGESKVYKSMQWIVNNKTKENIQVVVGPGDITNAGDPTDAKVKKMFASISKDYALLDDARIPYSIASGNHDTDATCTDPGSSYGSRSCTSSKEKQTVLLHQATMLNKTFPTSRAGLKGLTLYKAGEIQNSYRVFRVRNTNWLVLTLEFYPRAAVVKWAESVISSHPSYNIVIVTHGYMGGDTGLINGGIENYCASNGDCTAPRDLHDNLFMKYSNVKLLFSGHVTYESTRVDTAKDGGKFVQFKSTAHECVDANNGGTCYNSIRVVEIDLESGSLESRFCKSLTANSIDKCSNKTISGMKYITSGSSGASTNNPKGSATTFAGIDNFRDAAALNTTLLKPGLLYRSANLNSATAADKTTLTSLLKNGAIIDLRKSTDSLYKTDPALPGVSNIHIPITGVGDAKGYKATFVNDAATRAQFKKAIDAIANASGPILVHCKHGKDRTGWTVAMIMYIVGDGKYSNAALDTMVLNEYKQTDGADGTILQAALTEARTKYGSIMDYVRKGLGVSESTITTLKNRLGV